MKNIEDVKELLKDLSKSSSLPRRICDECQEAGLVLSTLLPSTSTPPTNNSPKSQWKYETINITGGLTAVALWANAFVGTEIDIIQCRKDSGIVPMTVLYRHR